MSGAPESPFLPIRRIQLMGGFDHDELRLEYRGEDQLGDFFSGFDEYRFAVEIDHRNLDLSPVVGIDGTGRIRQAQSFFYRLARPRSHLTFVSRRNLNPESGWNQCPFQGFEFQLAFQSVRGDRSPKPTTFRMRAVCLTRCEPVR
jgi:hypothetical protein